MNINWKTLISLIAGRRMELNLSPGQFLPPGEIERIVKEVKVEIEDLGLKGQEG